MVYQSFSEFFTLIGSEGGGGFFGLWERREGEREREGKERRGISTIHLVTFKTS